MLGAWIQASLIIRSCGYYKIPSDVNSPARTRHVCKDSSIHYLECDFSLRVLLNHCSILVSWDVSAFFTNIFWKVCRNLWPHVIPAFSRLYGALYNTISHVWGRPSLRVLSTGLCLLPLSFTLSLWPYPTLSYYPSNSCPGDRTRSFQYLRQVHIIWVLCYLVLSFKIKFLPNGEWSRSFLVSHWSIQTATLLSVSYVAGARLSVRYRNIFIMIHALGHLVSIG